MSKKFLSPFESANILGVRVHSISTEELIDFILVVCKDKHKSIVANVNIHALNLAYHLTWFRNFLNQSDVVFCDGFGVKLAACITRQSLTYRMTPPDFIDHLCSMAAKQGLKIFFLGAKKGIAQLAAEKLILKYPRLQIHTYHGYFNKQLNNEENQFVVEKINESESQILIVGFGMPLQEKWILDNFRVLDINIAFPAGALFDYISGHLVRPPIWMTDHGLEWLGRLIVEPRRLWRRYVIGNPVFFWRLFKYHILGIPLSNSS